MRRFLRRRVTSRAASDDHGASRKSALYLVGSSIQGLGLVIVQPFTLRVLDDEQWGLLAFSIAVLQVGVIVVASGLPLAITKSYFDKNNGETVARAISGYLGLTSVAISVLAAGVLALVIVLTELESAWHLVIAIVVMGIVASVVGGQAILRAQGRVVPFVGLSIGISLAANIAGLVFITVFAPTATIYMTGYALAVVVTTAVSLYLSPVRRPWSAPSEVKVAVRIGIAILPHSVALLLLAQGAVILLSLVSGPIAAGDYAKVQIFALAPVTLLAALNNAWVPYLMSASSVDRGPRLQQSVRKGALAAFLICSLGAGFANLGTRVIAPGNEDLVPLAQVLPLVSFGYFLYLMASTMLFVHSRTLWMAGLTPAVVLVGSVAAFVPARSGDVFTVALVAICGYLLLGFVYYLVARRSDRPFWSIRPLAWVLLAALAICVVIQLIPNTVIGGLVSAIVGVASAVLALYIARNSNGVRA